MTAIHQLVPTLVARDAIGNHTLALQDALRAMGHRSEVFALEIGDGLASRARPFAALADDPDARDATLVYQLSTGSTMAEVLLGLPNRVVLDYHSVTPSAFFRGWDARAAARLACGERQVRLLAVHAALGIADSGFDAADLTRAGCRDVVVVPVFVELGRAEPDPRVLARFERAKRAGGVDLLFVGRLAPNKGQHELVAALAAYRRLYDPAARLHLVGPTSSPGYEAALRRYAQTLGLEDAVEITGAVGDGVLAAHYRAADVFVSASRHEGFCVPLLEAMHHDLPIVAYAAAAVPETLGDAGIALHRASPAALAAATSLLLRDQALRTELVANGRTRLAAFATDRTRRRFADALARLEPLSASVRST